MAKYIKLFMVALFATLSFSLTSCGGDDDDEPSPNGAEGELTIDGSKYSFDVLMGGVSYDEFSCLLLKKGEDYSLSISITDWSEVSKGLTWNSSNFDELESMITVTWMPKKAQIGHGPTSGSVKVTNIDNKSKKVTLSFNKAEFEYYDGDYYNVPSFVLEGSITLPL